LPWHQFEELPKEIIIGLLGIDDRKHLVIGTCIPVNEQLILNLFGAFQLPSFFKNSFSCW
jgi:hypothetical protein